jgi:putative component of toxin-antitoxin plasmid stabilization module
MFQLLRYQREDGRELFTEWLKGLRNLKAQARIRAITWRSATSGVASRWAKASSNSAFMSGPAVVLLLTGGDKSSQPADIKRAKELWADWKRRQR